MATSTLIDINTISVHPKGPHHLDEELPERSCYSCDEITANSCGYCNIDCGCIGTESYYKRSYMIPPASLRFADTIPSNSTAKPTHCYVNRAIMCASCDSWTFATCGRCMEHCKCLTH